MSAPMAPGLLLAMPHRPDAAFAHAVVLVVEHDERGAFGLVVNRPTDVRLADVLDEAGIPWFLPNQSSVTAAAANPHVIWDGGPVMPGSDDPDGFILHHAERAKDGRSLEAFELQGEFVVYPFPPELEIMDALSAEPLNRLRFFMGYVEWEPGQLEDELRRDAWVVAPADPVLIFDTPPEQMWEAAFHSLGVDPHSILPSRGLH